MNKSSIVLFLLILGVLGSSCSFERVAPHYETGQGREIANSELEGLIEEIKARYEADVSAARKAELKVFQENLLKYLIEATGQSDKGKIATYKQATNYFNRMYPLLMANLKTEKEGGGKFHEIKKAPFWTLKEEIRFLNTEADKFPEAAIKVDLIEGMKLVAPLYGSLEAKQKADLGGNYKNAVTKVLGQDFDLHPDFSELEALLETNYKNDDEKILKVVELVERKINKHEKRIRNIGSEIANSGQVDLKNGQIRMVVRFMDYYFNKVPSDVIKTMMSELASAGPKLPQEEVMKIIFRNTGPGLGKVLQQIGKEKGVGAEFSKIMEILESSGKEVPPHLIREVIVADKGGFEIKSFDEKPLGTGTIAQVNRGKIWFEDQEKDVALRFLKPGVAQRCKEDIAILRQFVPDNEELLVKEGVQDIKVMATLIDSVEKFLDEEVDLSIAVERQKKAFEVYNRSVKISPGSKFDMLEMRVPEVYIPPKGKSNFHIQEFASGGVKFASLTDNDTKKIVAREMVRMWFEEALFKSGFLNADLHQGNFRVVLIEENNKIKILLYDFGLSSTLTKEDQRAFLLVGAGAYLQSPETLADGLMVSMNSQDKSLRTKLLKDIQAEMKVNPGKRPEDWVVWCVQKNYFVSSNLGAFARGSLLIKQLPESIGETTMFKETIVKTAIKSLGQAVADRDYDYPLNRIDMMKLGTIQIKNYCHELFQSFFKK